MKFFLFLCTCSCTLLPVLSNLLLDKDKGETGLWVKSASTNVTAEVGSSVSLSCYLNNPHDLRTYAIEWSREDQKPDPKDRQKKIRFVHVHTDHTDDDLDMKLKSYKNRTSLRNLMGGDASLTIKEVTLNDTALYKCFIPKLREKDENKVRQAFVKLTVVEPTKEDKKGGEKEPILTMTTFCTSPLCFEGEVTCHLGPHTLSTAIWSCNFKCALYRGSYQPLLKLSVSTFGLITCEGPGGAKVTYVNPHIRLIFCLTGIMFFGSLIGIGVYLFKKREYLFSRDEEEEDEEEEEEDELMSNV